MIGDKSKPESRFSRWVECFMDGTKETTKNGKTRIPISSHSKRYNRRWRRREMNNYEY